MQRSDEQGPLSHTQGNGGGLSDSQPQMSMQRSDEQGPLSHTHGGASESQMSTLAISVSREPGGRLRPGARVGAFPLNRTTRIRGIS